MSLFRNLWRRIPAERRSAWRARGETLVAVLEAARIWRWRLAFVPTEAGGVVLFGQESRTRSAAALVAPHCKHAEGARAALGGLRRGRAAIVSDAYVPGALRVPLQVRMVFSTASTRMNVTRRRRLLSSEHHLRRVVDAAEIERVSRDFLVSFASIRHGPEAAQLPLSAVKRLAEFGRLDLLLHGDEEVGAHLGYPETQAGKRCWVGCRVGYPARVHGDPRRLSDHNAVNYFLQFSRARDEGFDFYDLGVSPARPENGLLQFKKRLGGMLASNASELCVWIRPPSGQAPTMLWDAPLFSLEGRGLVLNVGLPETVLEGGAEDRFRDLAFDGLAAVRLHAAGEVPATTLESLRRHFKDTPVEVA